MQDLRKMTMQYECIFINNGFDLFKFKKNTGTRGIIDIVSIIEKQRVFTEKAQAYFLIINCQRKAHFHARL